MWHLCVVRCDMEADVTTVCFRTSVQTPIYLIFFTFAGLWEVQIAQDEVKTNFKD